MPRTPDRAAGPRFEEKLKLQDEGLTADAAGDIVYSGGAFSMRDSVGAFDPRAGGGGISEAQHEALRQLIHFIDEGPACGFTSGATKTVTGGLFPTLIEWKTSGGDLIVKKEITRSGGGASNIKPTPVVWTMYDTDGTTVLCTVSDAITYTGTNESSRVRTIT